MWKRVGSNREMMWNRRHFITQPAAFALAVRHTQASAGGAPGKKQFLAGAACANITPALGCAIAGNMGYSPAVEIHDELHVRSLVLDNGLTRLAFAVVDSCMVPGDVIGRAKRLIQQHTGIPPANVMISATHTHSAPPATHLFQSVPDSDYVEWLIVRISDSVRMAVNRLQPARVGWGVGREERLVVTRRFFVKPGTVERDPFDPAKDDVKVDRESFLGPQGPVDPEVGLLAVESLDGEPISVLGNYGLHYVGGSGRAHISADYFGYWAKAMARMAGITASPRRPPFVAILTNGCSGATVAPSEQSPPYVNMQRVADILAAECYRVWRAIRYEDWVELSSAQEEVEVGVRLPSAADVEAARRILASAPKTGQYKRRSEIYARETVILSEAYPKTVRTPVQALRIGSLGIATFPGEAFAELGLEVKAKSPFKPTLLIELANDYRGYIPTVRAFELGGYETWRAKSSYLEKEAAPKMVTAALRQLGASAR